jgi:Mycothiol maleylpyruvate isomerase N-terminal domain
VDLARQVQSIDDDGRRIAEAVRADPAGRVTSCPDWSGADLLAHVTGFARLLTDLVAGHAGRDTPFPKVPPDEAARTYDSDLARLVATCGARLPT